MRVRATRDQDAFRRPRKQDAFGEVKGKSRIL